LKPLIVLRRLEKPGFQVNRSQTKLQKTEFPPLKGTLGAEHISNGLGKMGAFKI